MSTGTLLIDPPVLAAGLSDTPWVVLDATVELPSPRFDGDYRASSGRTGWLEAHVPGAQHADLLGELAAPEAGYSFAMPAPHVLAAVLATLGVGAGSQVVVYDRSDGFWAARLWWMLHSLGVAARVLDGGLEAWRQAGLPLANGGTAPTPARKPLALHPRPNAWASLEEVRAISQGTAPGRLVCALGASVFDGSAPTRYSRRGHIPRSLNRPARSLYDSHGRYLPLPLLRQALGPELLNPGERLVLYCGGGISAAATAVALTLLGRDNVALYDGSLQQWSADPALPMTTGAAPA